MDFDHSEIDGVNFVLASAHVLDALPIEALNQPIQALVTPAKPSFIHGSSKEVSASKP